MALIGIGAWIGDNSLVCLKLIQEYENWKVAAIDPSSRNISSRMKIAAFNSLCNTDIFNAYVRPAKVLYLVLAKVISPMEALKRQVLYLPLLCRALH